MLCTECGSHLFLGKGLNYEEVWCPTCEGFKVLSRQDSINYLNRVIKQDGQEIRDLINLFDVTSLLPTLFVTRECYLLPILKKKGPWLNEYASLTDLISKILVKGSKGTKRCHFSDPHFQKLLTLTTLNNKHLRFRLLANQGWGSIVYIPSDKLKEIAVDFEIGKLVNNIEIPGTTDSNMIHPLFMFYEKWKNVQQNLIDNNFISHNEAYKAQVENIIFDDFLEEHLESVHLKTSLELSMNKSKMLDQQNFKNHLEYAELLVELFKIFFNSLEIKNDNPLNFECYLDKINKEDFERFIVNSGFNVQETYDLLVSKVGDKSNYPLIYDTGDELLIPPLTLYIFSRLLKALYSQELKIKLGKEGYIFEDKVCKALEDIGLRTDQPNNGTKKLIHVKDLENPDEFEIDIIAYNYDIGKLFVIDCKHIFVSSEFVSGTREQAIRKELQEQPDKQRKRINYIKMNLQRFGFKSKKIKKYVSVLITANKEPISVLENCHIISIREIEKIKHLEPL